jgi:hypothetical protein
MRAHIEDNGSCEELNVQTSLEPMPGRGESFHPKQNVERCGTLDTEARQRK